MDAHSESPTTIPREQDAPRPLIALMILLMLLGVAGAFTWIQQSEAGEQVIGHPLPLAAEGPIFTIEEIIEEETKGNLLGRDVAIWGAPVEEVAGNWVFWIGHEPDRAVPVVLLAEQTSRQAEPQSAVHTGDTLAIFGSVRAVRTVAPLDEQWAMERDEWERLAREPVYISALRVEHLAPSDSTT